MGSQCISFPALDRDQIARIEDLEGDLGTIVLAVSPGCHWADLNEDQLHKLQEAEKELGVILLAYQPD